MDYKLSFKSKSRIFEQPQVLIFLWQTNIVTGWKIILIKYIRLYLIIQPFYLNHYQLLVIYSVTG